MAGATHKQPHRVVIAEDDEAISEVISIILQEEGVPYTIAATGTEVMNEIKKGSIGLLFLDIAITGANGADICRKVKNNSQTQDIPVIIMSANSEAGDIAKEAGADGLLQKPFDIDDLVALVTKYYTRV